MIMDMDIGERLENSLFVSAPRARSNTWGGDDGRDNDSEETEKAYSKKRRPPPPSLAILANGIRKKKDEDTDDDEDEEEVRPKMKDQSTSTSSSSSVSKGIPIIQYGSSPPRQVSRRPRTVSISRQNPWGNDKSYAELILDAISSSPEKKLTLVEICESIEVAVPYFKEKNNSNGGAGWKNSIKFNLMLHNRFTMEADPDGRLWETCRWSINPHVHSESDESESEMRPRAASMETNQFMERKRSALKRRLGNEAQTHILSSSYGNGGYEHVSWIHENENGSIGDAATEHIHRSNDMGPYRKRNFSSTSSCGRTSPSPILDIIEAEMELEESLGMTDFSPLDATGVNNASLSHADFHLANNLAMSINIHDIGGLQVQGAQYS